MPGTRQVRIVMSSIAVLQAISMVVICADGAESNAAAPDPSRARIEFFERKIRPVLVKHCYECHSKESDELGGGLLLDHKSGLLAGGESGTAIVVGKPDASRLIKALRYDGLEMPPEERLDGQTVRDFEKWIADGAADPRTQITVARPTRTIDLEAGRKFWSFQVPQRPIRPVTKSTAWAEGPIDMFVMNRLEAHHLQPNRESDTGQLIRRVYFDLTGLPPSASEVNAFVQDDRPDAFERVVDRLLASPHYGERIARMWLDVARYAEDQAHIVGKNQSLFYPNAWMYRDWLIDAFNKDMPYDQFVVLQLAADLVDATDDIAALGFMGLGPKYYRRGTPEVNADEMEDRVDTLTRGFLGLTVACARCHDHKFDPIPTEDYYGLAGVYASTSMFNRPLTEKTETEKNGAAKKAAESMHVVRDEKPVNLPVYIRGDVNNKGEVVERHFLQVMSQQPVALTDGSGRLPLARAIADRDNPLVARVFVNRVWGMLTGQPIVATTSNFGSLGDRPTHPELLDELAVELMTNGWSVKQLQRQIVRSARYRQSSDIDPTSRSIDPQNRWMWRMSRRRLSAEQLRDNLLAVTGLLEHTLFGRSIDPQAQDSVRRTIYSQVSRFQLNALLALFDYPDPNVHAARRTQTTTPLQKLFIMNSPLMNFFAERLVRIELSTSEASHEEQVRGLYNRLFAREPSSDELSLALKFIANNDESAWQQYAHALLASNEMMFLD
jgi:hypothetical protein